MDTNMSIKLIQLASYTTPAVIEQKNKEWVEYGEDNNYYQYLIDLYYGSPTNNSAIKGISDMIYGEGLEVVKADRHLAGYLDLKKVFQDDCLRNCAMDLKMLGQYALHLVKSKDRKKYVAAHHWPIQTLRPERCDENGEIRGYYFAPDWSKLKRGQKPKRFDAFGFDESGTECILVCKPYSTGNYYFSPVDYQGGTQYANLEIEIANYHINNIMNGLAPSMLINFNNGQPPAEVKDMIEAQIQTKFSGSSNAGKFILSFNDNVESKADITPVQLSDAHNQYQFLSTESSTKIMVAHRITSPMLLGIKDNSGFGNNAEELKTASIFFDNTVIRPFQRLLLNGVQKVMNYNGYNLDIYFKTLQPLEFTDLSGKVMDAETKEKEYGFKKTELAESFTDYPESASNNARRALKYASENGWGDCGTNVGKARANQLANKEPISEETVKRMASFRRHQQNKDVPYTKGCGGLMWDAWGGESGISWAENKVKQLNLSADKPEFTAEAESDWLEYLETKGEVIGEEYELIEEAAVTDADNEGQYKFFKRFAEPEEKSKDDKGVYLIRYRYAPMQTAGNSRQFCKDMVANAKLGVVYRREDIDTMGDQGINGQFAPSGTSNYSIWKYKGGVNCHHQWYRLSYMRKRKGNGGAFLPLSPEEKAQGIKDIQDNYKRVSNQSADSAGVPFDPPSWDIASTKTKDLPNGGSLKNK
jgi:hypothetical protein